MPTLEELQAYYEELIEALNSDTPSYHFNSDRTHNAIVMRFMLDTSSNINMYCGEMSVFRKNFFKHIEENNDNNQDYASSIKNFLIESFHNFMQKEGVSMNIIFESFENEYLKDIIFSEDFLIGISEKKINLYKLSDDFAFKNDLYHFTYTDKGVVRFEQDKLQHSAICTINEPSYYESISRNFALLKKIARPIIVNA